MKLIEIMIILMLLSTTSYAQNTLKEYFNSIQTNEPNAEHPFGQIHPDAPQEIKQFEFMVGVSHCTDSILNPDGTYLVYPSV